MNLSILQRNTCDGFSEEAQALYLRGAARDEAAAFCCADEWDARIGPFLQQAIPTAHAVIAFIRERQFRRWFPDGRAT